jgi:hypothetical protein
MLPFTVGYSLPPGPGMRLALELVSVSATVSESSALTSWPRAVA